MGQLRSLVDSVATVVKLEQGQVGHCRKMIESPCLVGSKLDYDPVVVARCLACWDVVEGIVDVVQPCVLNRI